MVQWVRSQPSLEVLHAEKSSRNIIKSVRNQILFTMHRLIWKSKWTSVWFQINRCIVNTIWFGFDLIRFLCVASASRHHRNIIKDNRQISKRSQQYSTERFEGGSQLCPHYAEKRYGCRRLINKIPVLVPCIKEKISVISLNFPIPFGRKIQIYNSLRMFKKYLQSIRLACLAINMPDSHVACNATHAVMGLGHGLR